MKIKSRFTVTNQVLDAELVGRQIHFDHWGTKESQMEKVRCSKCSVRGWNWHSHHRPLTHPLRTCQWRVGHAELAQHGHGGEVRDADKHRGGSRNKDNIL